MKRRHRSLVAIGVITLLAGWFAWTVLLTESEVEQPPVAEQAP